MTAARDSAVLNSLEQAWQGPLRAASLVAEVNDSPRPSALDVNVRWAATPGSE